jgi:predicted ATPase
MKISYLHIQNFRGIKNLELDFVDDFNQIHQMMLLAGPNGSGKTSIMDAIWFGLQPQIRYKNLRNFFRPEPKYVIRTGQDFARVTCTISISPIEHKLIRQMQEHLIRLGELGAYPFPEAHEVTLEWTYPAQPSYRPVGDIGYKIKQNGWALLKGKSYLAKLKRLRAHSDYQEEEYQIGGVYFFEQERLLSPLADSNKKFEPGAEDEPYADEGAKLDPRPFSPIPLKEKLIRYWEEEVLYEYPPDRSYYSLIKNNYNHICQPHQMTTPYKTISSEVDLRFEKDGEKYGFDGLSSGERSVLNLLTSYFSLRMSNSILLIDEIEQHLHPTWQRMALLNFLRLKDDNQFLISTHSPYIRQIAPEEAVCDLGSLGEKLIEAVQ